MDLKTQKWRDHFEEREAKELRLFPLISLDAPLERAQYEVALNYFETKWNRLLTRDRVVALCADGPTRRAFFDFFGQDRSNWFCFRRDEWANLFKGQRKGSSVWPFQTRRHEFLDYRLLKSEEVWSKFGEQFGELRDAPLFLRCYGFRDASRAGLGGSDVWHWDGTTLSHLPTYDSRWIS
ncbi:hypothetical protein EON83_18795 [bacterium]|nr:MAG: hypothetical protein EON83_18795 [bacterium]